MRLYLTIIYFLLAFTFMVEAEEGSIAGKIYSLDDCISQALKKHPKIRIYSHKTEQKKEKLRSVTAESLSQVDAVASYDRLSYITQAKKDI
ncbi:MAG: hypothetical protein NC916_03095 [Candidatus Omnitrophica bacterium]|nr:hypothetical protein [Candidatus Omnitrophota bacterium]